MLAPSGLAGRDFLMSSVGYARERSVHRNGGGFSK